MKTETVILKVEKSVNDKNKVQPTIYTVIVNDTVLFSTTDLAYAL